MKKIICKVLYDTETARELAHHTVSFFGDPKGYEEVLFCTDAGKYFFYVNGGEESPYKKEDIKRCSKEKAEQFLAEYADET